VFDGIEAILKYNGNIIQNQLNKPNTKWSLVLTQNMYEQNSLCHQHN